MPWQDQLMEDWWILARIKFSPWICQKDFDRLVVAIERAKQHGVLDRVVCCLTVNLFDHIIVVPDT